MRNLIQILLVVFVFCLVNISFADNMNSSVESTTTATTNNQFYLGADAGIGTTNCDNCDLQGTFPSFSTSATSNTNFAGTVFAGFKPNPYIGAEIGYGVLPSLLAQINATDLYTNLTHYYGAVILSIETSDASSLFAKLGYGAVLASQQTINADGTKNISDETLNGPFFAVGLMTNFAPNTFATFAFNQILASPQNSSDQLNISYGTIGIMYLFS